MNDLDDRALAPIRQEAAPLRSRIIEAMRTAIERGVLQPGERLVEKELCARLGVSRTSLREALRELEAEGVITPTQTRGLIVVRISRRDASNIYRIRADVEALIVEQFVELATDRDIAAVREAGKRLVAAYKGGQFIAIVDAKRELYGLLCTVADNEVAHDLLSRLTLRTAQLRSRSVVRKARQKESIAEIEALVDAIARRDAKRARATAHRHVSNAARSALPFATE